MPREARCPPKGCIEKPNLRSAQNPSGQMTRHRDGDWVDVACDNRGMQVSCDGEVSRAKYMQELFWLDIHMPYVDECAEAGQSVSD